MGSASVAPLHRKVLPDELGLMLWLSFAAVALLAVSPIASFALSGFLLINLRSYTPRSVRWLLAVVLSLSLAMLVGSRPLDPYDSNDIDGYYAVYQNLAGGDLSELAHFGGGFEVALPSMMYAWSWLLPPLSVNGLMFCLAFSSALLFAVWLEKTYYSDGKALRPALMGICIVMLNAYFSTQLARQFLSLIMLLYAFSAVGRWRQTTYLTFAAAFHLAAIPFFLIYRLARRGWVGWLAIIFSALLLRIFFARLLIEFNVLPAAVAEKLFYYTEGANDVGGSDLASLRIVFGLALLSLIAVVAGRFQSNAKIRGWLAAPWITIAVYYLLLPIPLASLRATLMIHSVAPGLLAHKILSGRAYALLVPGLNALLLYKVLSFAMSENGANLRTTFTMIRGFVR